MVPGATNDPWSPIVRSWKPLLRLQESISRPWDLDCSWNPRYSSQRRQQILRGSSGVSLGFCISSGPPALIGGGCGQKVNRMPSRMQGNQIMSKNASAWSTMENGPTRDYSSGEHAFAIDTGLERLKPIPQKMTVAKTPARDFNLMLVNGGLRQSMLR